MASSPVKSGLPRASEWWSTAPTGCGRAKCDRAERRSQRPGTSPGGRRAGAGDHPHDPEQPQNSQHRRNGGGQSAAQDRRTRAMANDRDERPAPLHPAAGRHLAADGGDPAGRHRRLPFLPLSALPEVDYPTIQVQTFYPGASPEVMTSSVTAPLERSSGRCRA